jgi:uncharacterized protein (DUF1697 family)
MAWVALLRGINVGGRNKVPMAELRRLFEECGCTEVSSYIQSGNVLFTADEPDRAVLEAAVAENFGVTSPIVLRSSEQLARIVAAHPFGADTSHTHVAFLGATPGAFDPPNVAPDRFELVGSDVYLQYPNGVHGSKLTGALLERRLGVTATIRNWRTVTRLAELTS